ncbi:hypothetical protein ACPC54_19940 [Kitasatospora sp. NPDC094028]
MIGRWRGAPRAVVAVTAVYVLVLAGVGVTVHVGDLLRAGLHPYPWAPAWLNLYWSSLAVLDALAALLLLAARPSGAVLTGVIMATDLAANAYAGFGLKGLGLAEQAGLQRIAAFTAFVALTAPWLTGRLRDAGRAPARLPQSSSTPPRRPHASRPE